LRGELARPKSGDMMACKIILDRLVPIRKGRPVKFELPPVVDVTGLSFALAKVVEAVANGLLTPEEGASIAALLESQRKAIELEEVNKRLVVLEQLAAKGNK
jgi:hypothetical protein